MEIAVDEEKRNEAEQNFQQLIYSSTTLATKTSKLKLWQEVARAMAIDPLPVTPNKVLQFAAVLRGAGYRSGMAYIHEAVQMHSRSGYVVDDALRIAVADAKRGLERGRGGPLRSAEVRPEWLDLLARRVALDEVRLQRRPDGPRGGLHVWGLGMGFLLREVELAHLNVHEETLQIDEATGSATLRISASKMDPAGRGCSRTLACRCRAARSPSCPACSARVLLELALEVWTGSRQSEEARAFPLVGTMVNPAAAVSKAEMQMAAQADAAFLHEMGLLRADPRDVTGHFLRRSGAKALARAGVPLAKVQWLGRWGSAAVFAYVEEAAEEAPVDFESAGWDQIRGDLAQVLRNTGSAGIAAEPRELRQNLESAGLPMDRLLAVEAFLHDIGIQVGQTSRLCTELDGLVRPEFVLNLIPQRGRGSTKTVHRAVRAERLDPYLCSTSCGWRWGRASHARPVLAAELAAAGDTWHKCPRCFP